MYEFCGKKNMEKWYWCDIHYACFGFSILDGVINESAPIFSWAKGKPAKSVKKWLIEKRAVVVELK